MTGPQRPAAPVLPKEQMLPLLARAVVVALGGTPVEAELVMRRLPGQQMPTDPRGLVDAFRRHLDAVRS